jgi:hypothetical protein
MAEPSVTLVAVASPGLYHYFATDMLYTARRYFRPVRRVNTAIIEGDEGWPEGTMFRHHHLLNNFPDSDYVFLIDADMRFEGEVGPEILSTGITATVHPGYVGMPPECLPFEDRPDSHCYVHDHLRHTYYCGGFVGGQHDDMHVLSSQIALRIDKDEAAQMVPVWHDESALNSILAINPPSLTLSPAYCHPDQDGYYRQIVWTEDYPRKIVALDKTSNQRGAR